MTKVLKNSAPLKARRAESKGSGKANEVGSSIEHGDTPAVAKSKQAAIDDRIDAG